jgi:hypothetical protein
MTQVYTLIPIFLIWQVFLVGGTTVDGVLQLVPSEYGDMPPVSSSSLPSPSPGVFFSGGCLQLQ